MRNIQKKFRNTRLEKRLGLGICILMVSMTGSVGLTTLKADTIDSEKHKQEALESSLRDYESMLSELEKVKSDTQAYITELDLQLGKLTSHIEELNQQIEEKQGEIEVLNGQLAEQEKDIAQQYDAMKKRIQYMFENGNSYYLDMLLNSKGMADFLNRAEYMKEITDYDRKMLDRMRETKKGIETTKTQLVSDKEVLDGMMGQAEAEKKSVDVLLEDKRNELLGTNGEIDATMQAIREKQEEIEAQKQIVAELEELERRRKEEEERRRREEEERRKQEAAQLAEQQENPQEKPVQTPTYTSGGFTWPVPNSSIISSPYGYRIDPINGEQAYHNGLDIAAPMGTPIVATSGGEVAWAYHSASAGNWIGIDHGNGVTSVYMHCSVLKVSEGDVVEQGQVIALVGSTGRSTGPHLHFSIRKNGSYVDPGNYIDY